MCVGGGVGGESQCLCVMLFKWVLRLTIHLPPSLPPLFLLPRYPLDQDTVVEPRRWVRDRALLVVPAGAPGSPVTTGGKKVGRPGKPGRAGRGGSLASALLSFPELSLTGSKKRNRFLMMCREITAAHAFAAAFLVGGGRGKDTGKDVVDKSTAGLSSGISPALSAVLDLARDAIVRFRTAYVQEFDSAATLTTMDDIAVLPFSQLIMARVADERTDAEDDGGGEAKDDADSDHTRSHWIPRDDTLARALAKAIENEGPAGSGSGFGSGPVPDVAPGDGFGGLGSGRLRYLGEPSKDLVALCDASCRRWGQDEAKRTNLQRAEDAAFKGLPRTFALTQELIQPAKAYAQSHAATVNGVLDWDSQAWTLAHLAACLAIIWYGVYVYIPALLILAGVARLVRRRGRHANAVVAAPSLPRKPNPLVRLRRMQARLRAAKETLQNINAVILRLHTIANWESPFHSNVICVYLTVIATLLLVVPTKILLLGMVGHLFSLRAGWRQPGMRRVRRRVNDFAASIPITQVAARD